jgi:hypothetical protein
VLNFWHDFKQDAWHPTSFTAVYQTLINEWGYRELAKVFNQF